MVSSENPQPTTYGNRCGGKTPQEDAFNCQQQQNQQQVSIAKSGGSNCKVVSPQAPGGVEANSPHNNASNANGLTESLNQSRENATYDKVGNRNVDNSAGAGGGRKKRTRRRRHKKRFTKKRKTNKKSRRRMGGKTKRLSGWGCMSGGKRKTRKFKKHYMWNTKGKRYMAKTYKQHLRGSKLGHTHTKPKRKSKKTRKTRRTRRKGGNMTPGSPEHTAELERRKRYRAQGLSVREEADKRLEQKKGVGMLTKAMANMQLKKKQQNINERHSIGPGSELVGQDQSISRDRARTMG